MTEWASLHAWPELLLDRTGDAGVARITLNRPDKRNCWNAEMCDAYAAALEIVRADRDLKVVVTRGAGPSFSSGLDLKFLRESNAGPLNDWDRPNKVGALGNLIRNFPRIMIAQVHGYCLGGAIGLINAHDLVYVAEDAQIGMPEILRGSFGQIVTSTLMHGGLPLKKLAHIALVGKNFSGKEASEMGVASQAFPAATLETEVTTIARDMSTRHLAALEHHKIAVQLGRDLGVSQAIQIDQLVGQRLRRAMDPLADVENYLKSQKGGPNVEYKRPDVV
jgi:enoyl-CoA hydratase/carnithine racemase